MGPSDGDTVDLVGVGVGAIGTATLSTVTLGATAAWAGPSYGVTHTDVATTAVAVTLSTLVAKMWCLITRIAPTLAPPRNAMSAMIFPPSIRRKLRFLRSRSCPRSRSRSAFVIAAMSSSTMVCASLSLGGWSRFRCSTSLISLHHGQLSVGSPVPEAVHWVAGSEGSLVLRSDHPTGSAF